MDKFARRGIFLNGAVAEGFKRGVSALFERGPTEEEVDDFIAGYTLLAPAAGDRALRSGPRRQLRLRSRLNPGFAGD